MKITAKRLPSGYWHIRGEGPCNWAQPPAWPCSAQTLKDHAFQQASLEFLAAALIEADRLARAAADIGVDTEAHD